VKLRYIEWSWGASGGPRPCRLEDADPNQYEIVLRIDASDLQ
jgi:hypothetical protein